jgi:flagellar hook assembly protein FlgD
MVKLEIFDITGREIRTLVKGKESAGKHEIKWHGRNHNGEYVASGIYIYRMKAGDFRQTKKIIFLK